MQLTIQEVTREDSGRYYCRASDQDSTEGPLILNVTCKSTFCESLNVRMSFRQKHMHPFAIGYIRDVGKGTTSSAFGRHLMSLVMGT